MQLTIKVTAQMVDLIVRLRFGSDSSSFSIHFST